MFLGEDEHSLDGKGRIIIPVRHREELGERPVMAKGLDGCLSIYPNETFVEVAQQAREIGRRGPHERVASAGFAAGAVELTPDKQGRVAVPPHLRRYAELDKEIVIAGNFHRVDIWNAEAYAERQQIADDAMRRADGLAEIG
ncbi:MAG: division/cell wall cluster transcriptional repressor MraZ [Acidimicrobiia bacterium]|nr:division/cell wall cluster transcriptional repressor MraZ [Acidimicrobiia bacterium]